MAGISQEDFSHPAVTYQMGVDPCRIDILTELTGLTFEEAWPDRVRDQFGGVEVDYIGREPFIRNKRATGRPKDLADIDGLE
jgi:hypothetical protein